MKTIKEQKTRLKKEKEMNRMLIHISSGVLNDFKEATTLTKKDISFQKRKLKANNE